MKKTPKDESKTKQTAKSKAKKETKSEATKADAKREVVASSRRSKRKNEEYDLNAWDGVAGEWDEHWEEEWGEDYGWAGWNDQDKMWDKAAWQDGKSSLHSLGTKEPKEGQAAPPKRVRGKQTVASDATKTKPTKVKPEVKPDDPEVKKQKRGTRAKGEGAPAKGEDVPAKGKAIKVAAKAKSAPKHENIREGKDAKTLSDCEEILVKFGEEYKAMGDDYDSAKDNLKELKALQTTECVFNCYWKRPAVGVKSVSQGRDFAYFMFGAENHQPLRMAIAMKTAHMLVPCLNYTYMCRVTSCHIQFYMFGTDLT